SSMTGARVSSAQISNSPGVEASAEPATANVKTNAITTLNNRFTTSPPLSVQASPKMHNTTVFRLDRRLTLPPARRLAGPAFPLSAVVDSVRSNHSRRAAQGRRRLAHHQPGRQRHRPAAALPRQYVAQHLRRGEAHV